MLPATAGLRMGLQRGLTNTCGCLTSLTMDNSFMGGRTLFSFVPKALSGERRLSQFRYRGSLLNMEVSGYGDGIKSFTFDGAAHEPFIFAEELEGEHTIRIVLNGHSSGGSINNQPVAYSPLTPVCTIDADVLSWAEDTSATVLEYRIIRNGEPYATVGENRFKLRDKGEYQVVAVGENGLESFASEPLTYNGECVHRETHFPPLSGRY